MELPAGAIDADLHPMVPGLSALAPYLPELWRDQITLRGMEGFDTQSYPPKAPKTVRADWRPEGTWPASRVELLREQVLDPWRISRGIVTPLYGVQLVFNEDMGNAFTSALNDWTRAEWLENTELMIKRGAPVAAGEIAPIVDYLFAFYGRNDDGSPRPRPAGAAAAAPAAAPSASGSRDVQTVLATYGCTGCHAVDRKLVGPSFKEVAHRFGSEAGGTERVARRIREGGAGAWGSIPMPPHPAINDDELRALVTWVFAQR
jgi:cytochrome c551/c552